MADLGMKILLAILTKLLTETFFSRMLVIGLWTVSQKTTNTVDDKMVETVANALGVVNYK